MSHAAPSPSTLPAPHDPRQAMLDPFSFARCFPGAIRATYRPSGSRTRTFLQHPHGTLDDRQVGMAHWGH